ncbi:L-aspartate oxidase [Namhaeicola litoreus]|uniref:L-aspartate oxidase n=1 Tax=Namhaeicola litoreus TaxID=1052145 RepID=A0ABW3XYG7_9FLAO
MSIIQSDLLILGSGVAGLTVAIKSARALPNKQVFVVTKAHESESNTKYAQGGVAAVWDKLDSFNDHINDTMVAGDHENDLEVVKMVIEDAPEAMEQLIRWGAEFDINESGEIDLGKEGGHSAHRILHHKDITGFEIERTLLQQVESLPNITLLPYHFAIDLITEHHLKGKQRDISSCFGAYVLDQKTNQIDTFLSKTTILTTGGVGQVYAATTNPVIATGDGIAMAYRAKVAVKDMEFVQFHPTALYQPGVSPAFLISEAVRGFGAYLRNAKGERFMLEIDERAELAPRDIVSRAINSELIKTGDRFVYLDCTHLDAEKFINHFPNIYEKCKSIGIDVSTQYIPVVPAQHYMMGGVVIDKNGKTSLHNLYACGECSCSGLHGANRLASNSLLEALVYGNRIAEDIITNMPQEAEKIMLAIPEWDEEGTTVPKEKVLISHNRKTVQNIMTDLVAIVRSDERLEKALDHLLYLYTDTEKVYAKSKLSPQLCELRNLIAVAYLIVKFSLKRKENKGAFYSLDNL